MSQRTDRHKEAQEWGETDGLMYDRFITRNIVGKADDLELGSMLGTRLAYCCTYCLLSMLLWIFLVTRGIVLAAQQCRVSMLLI